MKNRSVWLGTIVALGAGVALETNTSNGLVLYLALLALAIWMDGIAERIHEKK